MRSINTSNHMPCLRAQARSRLRGLVGALLGCLLITAWLPAALAQAVAPPESSIAPQSSGPLRLTPQGTTSKDKPDEPMQLMAVPRDSGREAKAAQGLERYPENLIDYQQALKAGLVEPLSEFETFVSQQAQKVVRRMGAQLMRENLAAGTEQDSERQVPSDYLIGIGDEIQLTLWGSVDGDLRLVVDRGGRITIPRVGPVMVAGTRYAELNETLHKRVAQVFRNFQLSASLGKLRAIRVYVTGFTSKPGSYTVSSLSTMVGALIQAGGPSAAGSFRRIDLRRGGRTLATLDLYDLLVKGDKSSDLPLQAGDVVHVHPIGPQVGVLGSVNRPAVVELRERETAADALSYVGGLSTVADRSRVSIERLADRNSSRIVQLALPQDVKHEMRDGDLLRVFSSVNALLPQHRQHKRVMVQGEVAKPGEYIMPPQSTLADVIAAAGGLTPQAYIFGTEFNRESVRRTQQENYERALRDLETEFAKATTTQRALTADEAAAQAGRASASDRLIARLRAVRPNGRIVLQLDARAGARDLPTLALEDGDQLHIPARPNTVGVFGSVFNSGSFLVQEGSTISDMLQLAGGPTRGADTGSLFVLRANGSVVSARQSNSGWFSVSSSLNVAALPGDTVFVPEELNKSTFVQSAKEWTQILSQFGLGVAALKSLK
jgi:protein involved in polysaccharide export with SLBB domain